MAAPQPSTEEEALVASCADPVRFEELFERRAREIYRYLAHRAGYGLAEDLTAETFASAFYCRQRFDPLRGSARAWLYGIASNVVGTHLRSEGRRRRAYAREAMYQPAPIDAGDPGSRLADREMLANALAKLDLRAQDVVYLLAVVGLTYHETASALGVPIGTVRSRYARARAEITRLIDPLSAPSTSGGPTRRPKP